MHGGMTRRHEGFVSTMLTESGLSIPLQLRHFKIKSRMQADKHGVSGVFRLDNAHGRVKLQRGVYRGSLG